MTLPVFPSLAGIAWPVKRSPVWATRRQMSVSGKETRLPLWSFPQYRYELTFEFLRQASAYAEWQSLMGFYNLVRGSGLPFEFEDVDDRAVTGQLLGTGNGSTKIFPFVRTLGGFIEPVQSATTATLYLNGVAKTVGTDYTLLTTYQLGTVYAAQFATAPGSGVAVTADLTWRWVCQFEEDYADFEKFLQGFWSLNSLMMTTRKQ